MRTLHFFMLLAAGIALGVLASSPTPAVAPQLPATETETPPETTPSIELSGESVAQGETLVIEIVGNVEKLLLGSREIPFSQVGDRAIAIAGFDTRASTGERTLEYVTAEGTQSVLLTVSEKKYPVTKIVIPPKLAEQGVTSGGLATSITKGDTLTLSEILSVRTPTYYFSQAFVEPLDQWIDVGGFGNVREDANGSIRHLGVDLEGEIGDPVYATNHGKIAYAGTLPNYGKSVVIDHGLGIFSLYLHLSELKTQTGALAERGAIIGLVGNTGDYTLSPHLHFSIKVRDESVNPRQFIDTLNTTLR